MIRDNKGQKGAMDKVDGMILSPTWMISDSRGCVTKCISYYDKGAKQCVT